MQDLTPHPPFRAELKRIFSGDLPGLDDEPSDPKNCRIEITVAVGEVGDDAADDFTIFFVTPAWLADNIGEGEFRVMRYTVVLPEFIWEVADRAVRSLIARVDAKSLEEFVGVFSQTAYWEYSSDPLPG